MKFKIKFNHKNIIRYFYILIILINLVTLFYIYSFMKKHVYGTIVPKNDEAITRSSTYAGDVDIKKFEKVVEQIEKKSQLNSLDNIKDIFN